MLPEALRDAMYPVVPPSQARVKYHAVPVSKLIIDTDIVNLDFATANYTLVKGVIYTIFAVCLNTTTGGTNGDFRAELLVIDSSNMMVGQTTIYGADPTSANPTHTISLTVHTGIASGATTPYATLTITNCTGTTKHFHGWLYIRPWGVLP